MRQFADIRVVAVGQSNYIISAIFFMDFVSLKDIVDALLISCTVFVCMFSSAVL